MLTNKNLRYFMFGSMYFNQGTILSYFTALNALYFLSRGLSMTDVGIFSLIALIPFMIKILFGMLSDRVNLFGMGHRKPYMLLGLLVQASCLFVAPLVDPAQFYWGFVGLAFVLQMGMALYDTCTDGLAIDSTPEDEQGTIQGIMVGGRALGVVITSSIVGLLAQYVGWASVFWAMGVITLIPIPLVLKIQEGKRSESETFNWQAFGAFKQKSVIFLALLGFVFFFVVAGANQMVNPFLQQEFGISLSMAGYYTTVWGIGVVMGSAFSGQVYNLIGMKNSAWSALVIGFVGIVLLALTGGPGIAWVLVALFGISYGTYNTVYFALAMKFTDSRIAASMFSIMMGIVNVAQGAGMAVSGMLSDSTIGFRGTFVVLGLLNLLVIPLMPVIFGPRSDGPATP